MGRGGAEGNQGQRLRSSVDPASLLYSREAEEEPDDERAAPQDPASEENEFVPGDLDSIDDLIRSNRQVQKKVELLEGKDDLEREHRHLGRELLDLDQQLNTEAQALQGAQDQLQRSKQAAPTASDLVKIKVKLEALREEAYRIQARGERYYRWGNRLGTTATITGAPAVILAGYFGGPPGAGIALAGYLAPIMLLSRYLKKRGRELGGRTIDRTAWHLPEGPYLEIRKQIRKLNERHSEMLLYESDVESQERWVDHFEQKIQQTEADRQRIESRRRDIEDLLTQAEALQVESSEQAAKG
jgi:hypothetical protein